MSEPDQKPPDPNSVIAPHSPEDISQSAEYGEILPQVAFEDPRTTLEPTHSPENFAQTSDTMLSELEPKIEREEAQQQQEISNEQSESDQNSEVSKLAEEATNQSLQESTVSVQKSLRKAVLNPPEDLGTLLTAGNETLEETSMLEDSAESSSSKTVDIVVEHVAHGKPLDNTPSWAKKRPYTILDPSLKAAHQQLQLEKKQQEMQQRAALQAQRQAAQLARQQAQQAQQAQLVQQAQQVQLAQQNHIQQFNRNSQQRNPQQGQQQSVLRQQLSQRSMPPQPKTPPSNNMRPVQLVAAPRGLLPVPPGTVQHTSPDDHKFKKPMLPVKHRKVVDEEKRKREALEDMQRVQRHLQEAKRASQEAAQAKLAKQTNSSPQKPVSKPKPTVSVENQITDEMVQQSDNEIQKVCFNGDIMDVPSILLHSNSILRLVLSKQSFYTLSEESREFLTKFMPKDALEFGVDKILDTVFVEDKQDTKNSINWFHWKAKNGHFNADKFAEVAILRDTEKILYDHYIRMYHMKMLKKLVLYRHIYLEQYDTVSARFVGNPGPLPRTKAEETERRIRRALKRRADRRVKMLMSDCRQKSGEQGCSSDEELDDSVEPINKALQVPIYNRSTIYNGRVKDLDMWSPVKIDDVKTMLRKYKKFKKNHPKAPSLNLKGIQLDHVFERAGVLPQSKKIKEQASVLEKNLQRSHDTSSRLLFM